MHKQLNILLTAFEPFGGNATNITQEVLKELPDLIDLQYLHKVMLPVSFKRAPIALNEAIGHVLPDMVIMLGQCKEGEKIRLERFAHNMMDSKMGDNDHYCPNEEIICSEAPIALMTTIGRSLNAIKQTLEDKDLPVTVSSTAGLYVCNRVYYEALHLGQKALFVHIPKNMELYVAIKAIYFLLQNL